MKYNLPKGYLSYSSWNLWRTNKDAFRRKYYYGEEPFNTVETVFGKKVARMLEDEEEVKKHPVLGSVPRYKVSEYPIEVKVAGVPVKGYLDTFCPDTFSFGEYKSGHSSFKEGKPPWDEVKVNRHDQLPFYSLLIKTKHKKVNRKTYLCWIETRFKEKTISFNGHQLFSTSRELEMTGKIVTFHREIKEWERQWIKKEIKRVALEIHNDYTQWQQKKK